jgi:hypothetical protein
MDGFTVKDKPPHNVSVLERWLTEASKETGVAAGRLRRWLGFMVVAAMLDEARQAEDGEPLFLVKGGVAMELRIDSGARATKDFDTAFRASMGDEIDHVPAKSLDHVGLAGPDTVPCVAVRWQMAQKLHACTETFEQGGENDRFRDLLDLQLLADLVEDDEWAAVRAACIEVFESRAKQEWPPEVTLYESWGSGYEALAVETGFSITNVRDAADAVDHLIERIHQAT